MNNGRRRGRPRILIVVPAMIDGGVTRVNLDLAEALRDLGHPVEQFTMRPVDPSLIPHGDSRAGVRVGLPESLRLRYGYPVMAARLMQSAARADVLMSGWEVGDGLVAAYLAARMTGRPVVGGAHADPIGSLRSIIEYDWSPWITIPAARWVYPRLDAVVAVAEALKPRLAQLGVAEDSVRVINNGVNVERVRAMAEDRAPDWLPDGDFVVSVGRLANQKGYDLLIQAHARLRADGLEHSLVLVGEGPDRQALEALAARLGVRDSVLMPGFVENPFPVICRASACCLSSRYEGFPLVLLEVLSLGAPAIATDCVSGPSEVLAGGRYGDLVPVESVDGLVEAIGRHLRAPEALREKGRLARERSRDFSITACAERYSAFFDELLAARSRGGRSARARV